jgi:hypothetical protein
MKKLPIGIQSFSEIRNEDYLYIDKTKEIFDLIDSYKYVFLSRPRRFGKSLLISTIAELFRGNEEYFKGLYIHDKWNWEEKYPVIEIKFDGIENSNDLKSKLESTINEIAKRYNIEVGEYESSTVLRSLIIDLNNKFNKQVIILIDEYDKAILDNITDIPEAKKCREILKVFYSQIKGADQFIKFAMLTGVTKYTKTSVFSGLNNIYDISLKAKFGSICGYTQNDLDTSFKNYLENVNREKLKEWYNGYFFFGEKVYNPYDILLFIENEFKYKNYWFETGTPTYLMKLISENNYYIPRLDNLILSDAETNGFDIERIRLETILIQAGYLTIESEFELGEETVYKTRFPNKSVKISFYNYLANYLINSSSRIEHKTKSLEALYELDIEKLKDSLIQLFTSISYNSYVKNTIANYEGYYSNIIYVYLKTLGYNLIQEDCSAIGRMDLSLIMGETVLIFEFKVSNEDPLKQIKAKKYYEKYSDKEVYIIGINFDIEKKNIGKFVWEKID